MLFNSDRYAVKLWKANSHYQCQKQTILYHMHSVFWLTWESSTEICLMIILIYIRATLLTASVETEKSQKK